MGALKKSSSDNLNNSTNNSNNSNSNDNSKIDANNKSNTNSTNSKDQDSNSTNAISTNSNDKNEEEKTAQPWYFHVVASFILVIHGLTFLVPHDPETEDTDMMRIIGKWFGFDWDWMEHFTPYAQGLAAVFNIALGIVSWWTSKESERYNRLIQLRVFVFCLNILHAYITGPIIYQSEDTPLLAPGRIIGLFRLSYLTPGLMAAGVTEVIVEKDQDDQAITEDTKKPEKKETKALQQNGGNNSSNKKSK